MENPQDKENAQLSKPVTIKSGKGKKAVALLVITKHAGRVSGHTYEITHIPTGALVMGGYYYLSQARVLAQELVNHFSDVLNSSDMLDIQARLPKSAYLYLHGHVGSERKQPLSYEDYVNGPDYDELLSTIDDWAVLSEEERQHAQELCDSLVTLGWVPGGAVGTSGCLLDPILEGRHSPSEDVLPSTDKR